jgi:hypothetical protein
MRAIVVDYQHSGRSHAHGSLSLPKRQPDDGLSDYGLVIRQKVPIILTDELKKMAGGVR